MNHFTFVFRPSPAAALAACLFCAPAAQAQTITNSGALSFGAFVAGTGGSIVVAPSGGRSRTGGVMLVPQGGIATAAQFSVTGDAGATFAITLPADGTMVELTSGSNTMAVHGFSSSPAVQSLPPDRIVRGTLTGGSQPLSVGATLTVGPAQTPGSYTGSFAVTVHYE